MKSAIQTVAAAWRKAAIAIGLLGFASLAGAMPVTYSITALNITARTGTEVGLGSHVFHDTYTYMRLTFTGDTSDVRSYVQNNTSGYLIDQGVATLWIRDAYANFEMSATFDPGQIFVGSDIHRGIGFGSTIYPIYPFALLDSSTVDTAQIDLQQDFQMSALSWGLTCVSIAQNCTPISTSDGARNHPLHTDQGDFWIMTQGITQGVFSIVTDPNAAPAPNSALLAIAALWALRRVRRKPGTALKTR
jgi:hypothetical protein